MCAEESLVGCEGKGGRKKRKKGLLGAREIEGRRKGRKSRWMHKKGREKGRKEGWERRGKEELKKRRYGKEEGKEGKREK